MTIDYWIVSFLLFSCLLRLQADSDSGYRACVEQCEKTGCIGERCFPQCNSSYQSSLVNRPWYMQGHFYLQLKQWYCQSDCQYNCIALKEKERAERGLLEPVKYNGKWHLISLYCFQEPVSVALSVLNLLLHLRGWRNFYSHVYSKLPLKRDKTPYYDFTGLWTIYAIIAMNHSFWGAVYHSRDMYLTKLIYSCSGVALLGYLLILSLIRSFSFKDAAARVMVAAPLIAFTTTHILYLNNYKIDYEWNAKVCTYMAIMQLIIWSGCAILNRHPSQMKLWMAIIGSGLSMVLEKKLDFPPYKGMVDTRALWHALMIPVTCIWWSFARDDADYKTSIMVKKGR